MNHLISEALHDWYVKNKRPLPWRRSQDPYSIWISEVMLQQTTVRAVIPYYEKFLRAFPTIDHLAKASEEAVLGLWSGLGYYSRAKNLHRAAKEIKKLGDFPKTHGELLKLSGIGPYTAAAVASMAFNEEVAAIDGNVSRVVSRIFDIDECLSSASGKMAIRKKAAKLIEGRKPAIHNQAMMELGATVCTPRNPACLLCPASTYCLSFKAGTVLERPVKPKGRKAEPWLWTLHLVSKKGRIALVKNGNGTPWLKNTWVLPGKAVKWSSKKPPAADFKHAVTHHNIFVKLVPGGLKNMENMTVKWIHPRQIEKFGVSSIVIKALKTAGRLQS